MMPAMTGYICPVGCSWGGLGPFQNSPGFPVPPMARSGQASWAGKAVTREEGSGAGQDARSGSALHTGRSLDLFVVYLDL